MRPDLAPSVRIHNPLSSLEFTPAPAHKAFPPLGRNQIAALILITLLGLGLRFYHLTSQSLWQDEIGSIVAAEAPLGRMYEYSTRLNNCLPTYSLLLSVVSPPDPVDYPLVGRSLSALAGALSVPLFIAVVFLWRRQQTVALCAGLLLAVNPLHLWYSQEMRPYAMVLACGLLTLLCFELARRDSRSHSFWWGLYLCAALATALLHKSGLIFPLLCVAWHAREVLQARARFRDLAIHAPIGVTIVLLQLVKSYPPGELYTRGRSILEIAYSLPAFLGGYSFGPSLTSVQSLGPMAAALRSLPQLGLLGGTLLLAGLAYLMNFRALRVGRETWLFVLDLGIVAAYSVVAGFPFNVRYALPALLGFLGLLSLLAGPVPTRRLARVSLAAALAISLWADGQWFYSPAYRKADARGVAQWLMRNKDNIQSWTGLPAYFNHCLKWYLTDADLLARELPPAEDLRTDFPPTPDVLILGRRHHVIQPDRIVDAYRKAAGPIVTNLSFTGYEIYQRQATLR